MTTKKTNTTDDLDKITTQRCICCLKEKKILDYYLATNKDIFTTGRTHICKDCIRSYVYFEEDINIDKLKNMLRLLDIPFYKTEFETSLMGRTETFGAYMKNVQLNHKTETWDNGDMDYNKVIINNEIMEESDFKLTQTMLNKWGKFNANDIEFLETSYYEWTTRHKCDSKAEEILFEEICQMQLDIKKTREADGEVIKKVQELQKLLQSANVRPLDKSAIQTNESMMIMGNMINTMERKEPAEYFDEMRKKEYRDYMGYKKYFDNWLLRPLKNLLTGSKDFVIIEDEILEEE